MSGQHRSYDVFVSYAREDGAWVRQHLYEPLLRCRTKAGTRPRVFLDVGEECIAVGENWIRALARAIVSSNKFVLVYSMDYFRKEMCRWELTKAFQRDPNGTAGIVNPILIDKLAESQVPVEVNHINYRDITRPGWFESLCAALDLTPVAEQLSLAFLDQPQDTVVNHTLLPVRVALLVDGRPSGDELEITLSSELAMLQGTTTLSAQDGVATFEDLFLGTAVDRTRLAASAAGCKSVFSETFSVTVPPAVPDPIPQPEQELGPYIPHEGHPVFFADGQALVILMVNGLVVYDAFAQPLRALPAENQLRYPLRWIRRTESVIAMADWFGGVQAVWHDGHSAGWDFGDQGAEWAVPGGMAFSGDHIYVGFWNGAVYELRRHGEPRPVFINQTGVQALACAGDRFLVCGFDGKLCIYQEGRMVNTRMLEPGVHLLQASDGRLVAIGEKNLYQIQSKPLQVLHEELLLSDVAAVLGDVAQPVVIDSGGRGIRFDGELTVRATFRAAEGAVPVSADHDGRCCVFRYPDSSHTLMMDGRVVFGTASDALAVAPNGELFAVGSGSGIRLVTADHLMELVRGERHGDQATDPS